MWNKRSPKRRAELPYTRTPDGGFLVSDRARYKVLGWLRAPPPAGPPVYIITDIGTLPGAVLVSPGAINLQGEVVGAAILPSDPNPVHGFSWTPATGLVDLFPLVFAAGYINNLGPIVGTGLFNGRQSPFIFANGIFTDVGATTTSIGTLGPINNLGQAVGQTLDLKGLIYDHGTVTLLNVCSEPCISTPFGINDFGQVVGTFNQSGSAIPFFTREGRPYSALAFLPAKMPSRSR